MGCNYPIQAFKCADGGVVFDERKGDVVHELRLPCGQCDGCRIERARQWSVRCMHEASLYEDNCFITLTYNDEHLPPDGDLHYEHFQLFMKRLRKKFSDRIIRFFMCGEYGSLRNRPHFHACLFNIDFADRVYFKDTSAGSKIYTSKTLDSLWSDKGGDPIGFATVGDVNSDSAGYVARYSLKKSMGRWSHLDYQEIDYETGEVYQHEKEFIRMSLKPGIGAGWYKKWKADIFPLDQCIVKGKKTKPPRYYTKMLAIEDPLLYDDIQYQRHLRAIKRGATPERLENKEIILKAQLKFLKREL